MSNGNGHRWSKFWWQDWDRDMGLRMCSLAAQGLWMRMLCLAHDADRIGHVTLNGRSPTPKQLAGMVWASEREVRKLLAELEQNGVFSRTDDGVIYCRRMVREAAAVEAAKGYGSNGGNPNFIRGTVAKDDRQRAYRRGDSPLKTERIFQRDGGRCHWCNVQLERENERHPHFFHVDHVVAVRDGGGTDEDNLVAACQRCNMERARHPGNGTSDNNPPHFRQQPPQQPSQPSDNNPRARASEAYSDSEVDTEKEKKVSKYNHLLTTSPVLARVEAACEAPPAGTFGAPIEETVSTPAIKLAVKTIVGKVGRSLESRASVPLGKAPKLTVVEQCREIIRGPVIADAGPEPPRRGPCEPQRTVEEQLAWIRAEMAREAAHA